MLRYDEAALIQALSRLPERGRALFAARVAERLFALYEAYAERAGQGEPQALRAALDGAWSAVGADVPEPELAHWQQTAEGLVPDEDEDWIPESAYGQHGAAAVAYALRTRRSGDVQEAAWGARQIYDAADYAAQQQLDDGDLDEPGAEDALLRQPVVQLGLSGIADDLAAATSGNGDLPAHRREAGEAGRQLAALALGG